MIRLFPRALSTFGMALLCANLAAGSLEAKAALPSLQTLAAQEALLGIAQPGQDGLVTSVVTLESGEGFARLRFEDGTEGWMQVRGALPREGERFAIEKESYLFRTPVVEEAGEESVAAPAEVGAYNFRSMQPMVPGKLGISGACSRFIDSSGGFGSWGSYVMGRLNSGEHGNLLHGRVSDLGRVCPKFNSLSETGRKNFITWLVASMAAFESGCNEKVKAKGVNGTAAGLLQLHLGHESSYGCRAGMNSLDGQQNLECGLTMLNNDVGRTGKFFPSSGNYWQVLRPQSGPGQRTLRVARAFGPCF